MSRRTIIEELSSEGDTVSAELQTLAIQLHSFLGISTLVGIIGLGLLLVDLFYPFPLQKS